MAQRALGLELRHLAEQRHERARRQNKPYVGLGPGLGREIDGDERAESGLNVGKEENKPVEAAQASRRWRAGAKTNPCGTARSVADRFVHVGPPPHARGAQQCEEIVSLKLGIGSYC